MSNDRNRIYFVNKKQVSEYEFNAADLKDRGWTYEDSSNTYSEEANAVAEISSTRLLTLPTDSATRKDYPVLSGCIKYFPAAIAGVANISKLGNDKHNPGQELHHSRGKSTDHGDCIIRHLIDTEDLLAAAAKGSDKATQEAILLEVNQMVWRALAYSQRLHEQFGAPMAPAAKL